MPVRNGEKYLDNSIFDITKNLAEDDEVIVINDGSEDQTDEILAKWMKSDKRVRVYKNFGEGLVKSLNFGICEASNEWIARFDVDDKYPENRLKLQRQAIDGSTVCIFGDYQFWAGKHANLGIIPSAIDSRAVPISLLSSQRTAHPVALFSKSAVMDVGGYREEDFPAEDISLWLRLSRQGKLKSVPEILLNYQLRNTSISGQKYQIAKMKGAANIAKIGIDRDSIVTLVNEWEDLFSVYDAYSSSSERKILLAKDLALALKYGMVTNNYKWRVRNRIMEALISSSTPTTILKLAHERNMRKKFRNKNF